MDKIFDNILDQISLEGLSGVTFRNLLSTLEAQFPETKCMKNVTNQNKIWSVIMTKYINQPIGAGIQAFIIDETQDSPDLNGVFYDRPLTLPQQTIQHFGNIDNIIQPVQDSHTMGSCVNYRYRIDVSQELFDIYSNHGNKSLKIVDKSYGLDKVYLVADQVFRNRALFPHWVDPNINVTLREYCVLELIGRSREKGCVFPKDKTFGRYRLLLLAKKLITQYQLTSSSPIEHHLLRFATDRVSAVKDINYKLKRSAKYEDDDDDLDFDYDDALDGTEEPLRNHCFDYSKLRCDRSIFSTLYDFIADSDGVTQLQIRRGLNMPKFHLRNHLKNMISIKMIYNLPNPDADNPFKIYKTAYKSNRRNKIREESLVKPTHGLMANWDEVDLRAKRIIGLKRSSFSQAEDSLLILCRIVTLLLAPKPQRLSWCVNKRVVRDLLHKELVEAHDKTSDACLRRIKYLKRLPNNIMSINELTAELKDDPAVIRITDLVRPTEGDSKMKRHFLKLLKVVRARIPNLLGISTWSKESSSGRMDKAIGLPLALDSSVADTALDTSKLLLISDHSEFQKNYELYDCQSVSNARRGPTFTEPKNSVDIKFNNVCLTTMAYILSSSLMNDIACKRKERTESIDETDGNEAPASSLITKRNSSSLEKFFSYYPDKLVNSVISKLNRRSLLTKKCPPEQASMYKPKTRMSFKLNRSVLFLLNRHQSSSLIQLACPASKLCRENLSESNDLSSIALLTSLCSLSLLQFDIELKIPENVVSVDQEKKGNLADCLIVHPCGVKFESGAIQDFVGPLEALKSFLSQTCSRQEVEVEPSVDKVKKGPNKRAKIADQRSSQQQPSPTKWQIRSFLTSENSAATSASGKAFDFQVRLWKQLDGNVHRQTLLKIIESILSWVIVCPGVELSTLHRGFEVLIPSEHLDEILGLMQDIGLIESRSMQHTKPSLFGSSRSSVSTVTCYLPTSEAFLKHCQLMENLN